MDSETLSYSPLSRSWKREIRLLHLAPKTSNPEEGDSPIKCSLSTVALYSYPPPQYEALSYVWGDATKEKLITIDGQPVRISRNLHQALRDLQLGHAPRTIWADAVCINQTDLEERAHQVAQMHLIYSRASNVAIYLGPAWEGSDDAMYFWESLAQDEAVHFDSSLSPHVSIRGRDINSADVRRVLEVFFDTEWWKRVWTVQEFVLAETLTMQYGTYTLARGTLELAFHNFRKHERGCCGRVNLLDQEGHEFKISMFDAMSRWYRLRKVSRCGTFNPFLRILWQFSDRQTRDARDKIYGMLGLSNLAWTNKISPDYTIPTEQLFRSFLSVAIEITKDLEILSLCQGKRGAHDLPSFVPDWASSVTETMRSIHEWRLQTFGLYNTSKDTQTNFRWIDASTAVSGGHIIDCVAAVTSGPDPLPSELLTGELWNSWIDLIREHCNPEGLPLDPIDWSRPIDSIMAETHADWKQHPFWPATCGGLYRYRDTQREMSRWRRLMPEVDFHTFLKWLSCSLSGGSFDEDAINFHMCYSTVASGRQFAVTEKGSIGWVPGDARAGDCIAVLAGGKVPYVLRKCEDKGEGAASQRPHYTFLGDAYITGIMDGETVDEEKGIQGEIYLV
ncbi:HET-domain-containing protein [Sporormia fimetaria CBS 119925]|uniref:HET-domain-containing protein n=1 Tax=Sporormia fimetaria CBS 119925 TaxID=1340428 RepID=A0A6A6VJ75_9PLEO|nr:HET-domain-containing protein [Sporormia fimetaria CBS 119925]